MSDRRPGPMAYSRRALATMPSDPDAVNARVDAILGPPPQLICICGQPASAHQGRCAWRVPAKAILRQPRWLSRPA